MVFTTKILTAEQRAALGDIVAVSAQLESHLDMYIGEIFTRLNQRHFEIVIGSQMLGRKLEMVKELGLLKLRSKKLRAEFATLVDNLTSVLPDRNAVVHGIWGGPGGMWALSWIFGPVTGSIEATHKKKGGKVRVVKAEQLAALAERIYAGDTKLFHFVVENVVRKRGRPLPRKKPIE